MYVCTRKVPNTDELNGPHRKGGPLYAYAAPAGRLSGRGRMADGCCSYCLLCMLFLACMCAVSRVSRVEGRGICGLQANEGDTGDRSSTPQSLPLYYPVVVVLVMLVEPARRRAARAGPLYYDVRIFLFFHPHATVRYRNGCRLLPPMGGLSRYVLRYSLDIVHQYSLEL